ncbi:DUF6527 family protein [Bradyrhizobium sp. BR 1432]|uniref:DUF6527 family protein n=1 Tax=Bradyrhizobium sp. BR 1432 TaxID=3447966 RepID=UPI003EE51A1F
MLKQIGDVALDQRGVPRSLVMMCPDGCGDILTINLDRRAGKAWRADVRDDKFTLYPSVWRDEGCEAHFILWKDRILWCDRHDGPEWRDDRVVAQIRDELGRHTDFVHYETLAEGLAIIPWEALWACQALVRSDEAEARNFGYFRMLRPNGPAIRRGKWA